MLRELRLAATLKYTDQVPAGNTNLSVNSPLLVVCALVELPHTINGTVAVVIDDGLTIQRPPHTTRTPELVSALRALNLAPGKLTYAVVPVEATEHLSPDDAARHITGTDFANLASEQDQADLLRRLT
jgi:hypothetical protein